MNSSTDKKQKQSFKDIIKHLYQACPKWAKTAYIVFLFINVLLLFVSSQTDRRRVVGLFPDTRDFLSNENVVMMYEIQPSLYFFPFSYTVPFGSYEGSDWKYEDYGRISSFDIVSYDVTDFLLYTITSLVCIVTCLLLVAPFNSGNLRV